MTEEEEHREAIMYLRRMAFQWQLVNDDVADKQRFKDKMRWFGFIGRWFINTWHVRFGLEDNATKAERFHRMADELKAGGTLEGIRLK